MAGIMDICNMALSHIGDDANLQSFEDGTVQAAHCRRFYDVARRAVLELGSWSFAERRTANLAAINQATSSGWAVAYTLPSDCIKPIKLLAPGQLDERKGQIFRVEGRTLYCNTETPTLLYLADLTDTTKFTMLFVDALSYYLAGYLAGPILKSVRAGEEYFSLAAGKVKLAGAVDANATSQDANDIPAGWALDRGAPVETFAFPR